MQGVHLRKYGVETTIDFELYEVDGVDLRVDAAHAAGDSTVMKDEGAEANTANGFTDEGRGYSIVVSAAEVTAARVVLYIVDQTSPKAWLDKVIVIETYGHASAMHAFDFDTAAETMRGTDSAALASVCTEARLAELAAANLPADVDTLLARITAAVALASVCTEGRLSELDAANVPANVDTLLSRVTAAVALASVCTEGRLAELDAANLPADVDVVKAAATGAPNRAVRHGGQAKRSGNYKCQDS